MYCGTRVMFSSWTCLTRRVACRARMNRLIRNEASVTVSARSVSKNGVPRSASGSSEFLGEKIFTPRNPRNRLPLCENTRVADAFPTVLDHYRVLSLIGAGGMGEVYLASDD